MQVKNKKGEIFTVSQEHYEAYKHDLELVTEKPTKEVKKKVANERKTKAAAKEEASE
ncbi:hypothetical protein [Vibrio parahaemolyticus]|uniref:hypothetical protein n=1 Tax=Vibrio parahaemolyticus TaxID=670 RepID=UPI0015E0102A|nr:hypothetical protein [Vibrio parahaemolyticus]HCE1473039.1 hypothetical protein [Vibrio parahaemolyticus]HCE1478375.1 hypothetical protein [Vibrio parahaemolyticus]HCE1661314.1 hypothetical protein [Vibrio parahaemolyticus]HCE1776698.1 hypothetical protein [Vibrio parahaemolyticus]HCG7966102.1 hypothetical protein [Vibrio parahaemolyticus]